METGAELTTFITGLNADADIDATLLEVLVENAKTIIEGGRPWVTLRRTNSALTVAEGVDKVVDMSSITDFSHFYGDYPVKLHDGNNRTDYFRQVPFDRKLEYKDDSQSFCHDIGEDDLYFNGKVAFAGNLHLNYIKTTDDIDLAAETAVWTEFPKRFLPLLGYYAIGINKGAIDYDSINRDMLPGNFEVFSALKDALEKWDENLQQSEMAHNDPTDYYGDGHRDGAINRNA